METDQDSTNKDQTAKNGTETNTDSKNQDQQTTKNVETRTDEPACGPRRSARIAARLLRSPFNFSIYGNQKTVSPWRRRFNSNGPRATRRNRLRSSTTTATISYTTNTNTSTSSATSAFSSHIIERTRPSRPFRPSDVDIQRLQWSNFRPENQRLPLRPIPRYARPYVNIYRPQHHSRPFYALHHSLYVPNINPLYCEHRPPFDINRFQAFRSSLDESTKNAMIHSRLSTHYSTMIPHIGADNAFIPFLHDFNITSNFDWTLPSFDSVRTMWNQIHNDRMAPQDIPKRSLLLPLHHLDPNIEMQVQAYYTGLYIDPEHCSDNLVHYVRGKRNNLGGPRQSTNPIESLQAERNDQPEEFINGLDDIEVEDLGLEQDEINQINYQVQQNQYQFGEFNFASAVDNSTLNTQRPLDARDDGNVDLQDSVAMDIKQHDLDFDVSPDTWNIVDAILKEE